MNDMIEPIPVSRKTLEWMRKQPGFTELETKEVAGVKIRFFSTTMLSDGVAIPIYVMPEFAPSPPLSGVKNYAYRKLYMCDHE